MGCCGDRKRERREEAKEIKQGGVSCPGCGSKGTLDWILGFCEFKCTNCGEKFTITDLHNAGQI